MRHDRSVPTIKEAGEDHEQDYDNRFGSGKLKRAKNIKRKMKEHKAIAESSFKKDARINIRLSSRDLRSLQARALKEGIPYQTLVSRPKWRPPSSAGEASIV
ncbi:MAG: antitoxin [Candidatus Thiodiazotropha taylori]|nr:antitoxin [Candidatus Thiodiazotropha taylori]MCG8097084.1 antitoxin [Candidatus Thiodiazotropha endolucinida]MCG7880072.1 antitoxin [Candidatus Thiodiazotropha taylori]MCG7888648.1 antitoxin [Candidatus Thiodiazotropha taylori]MCG7889156.1 antitoxin [Candidatus Thiodiazotropha taylori]